MIGEEGRELQRRLLQATFDIDSAREERADGVTSAAGIQHGTVEAGHGRGVTSVFGPVRVTRMAYRNRREPNLYPADARQVLPGDPYSLGMRSLAAFHLAAGGFGQAQEVIEARTGVTVGRAQLTGLAEDLAAWTDDFYAGAGPGRRHGPAGHRRDHDAGRRQRHRHAPGAPQERRQGRRHPARDQEDGRDRRGRRLHPRRPPAGGHRRPARPPPGAPRPEGPRQMGIGVGHRVHRGHDRGRVRRGRPPRPPAHPPAGLPRRREQAADHRHRGPRCRNAASKCPS